MARDKSIFHSGLMVDMYDGDTVLLAALSATRRTTHLHIDDGAGWVNVYLTLEQTVVLRDHLTNIIEAKRSAKASR